VRLVDVVTLKRGKTYKSALLGDKGMPLLGLATIEREGGFRREKCKKYSGDSDSSLIVKSGEIYASLKDVTQSAHLLGSVARLPPEVEEGRLTQDTVLLKIIDNAFDPSFLYWILRAPQTRRFFKSLATGTTNLGLSREDFLSLELPEATPERIATSKTLDRIERLIELNRKSSEILEEMFKALFRSWFVDFDPVRAKAEGRSTGLPDEISDLFPDSFEEADLGKIPRGWQCLPLADRAIYLSRGISPSYCEEGGVLVLNQKCIRDSRVSFAKARRHDTTKRQISGREVKKFDALVNSTGVGTLGRVAMMPACQEDVVVDSHVTVVRGSDDKESFFISSMLLNRQAEIEALGEGSTGQTELARAILGALQATFPPSRLISAFFDCAHVAHGKIEANVQNSFALARIRDTLLPKLISGELRIPDAERLLEEAGV
jgi:type I restriction enzyme S subunit